MINLVGFILIIGGMAAVFRKAGYPWWAAIVPIYNMYILCKVTRTSPWWVLISFFGLFAVTLWGLSSLFGAAYGGFGWLTKGIGTLVIIGVASSIVAVIVFGFVVPSRLSRAFGHGVGMSLGLIFLPFIFYPILGFDKSAYQSAAPAAPAADAMPPVPPAAPQM